MSDETALYYEKESKRLFTETDYCVIGNLAGAGFGDPGAIPAPFEKHPRGSASLTSGSWRRRCIRNT